MPNWTPLCVLPNVQLALAVGNEYMALAPVNDERVSACCAEQPLLADFLNNFTDAFEQAVRRSCRRRQSETSLDCNCALNSFVR